MPAHRDIVDLVEPGLESVKRIGMTNSLTHHGEIVSIAPGRRGENGTNCAKCLIKADGFPASVL